MSTPAQRHRSEVFRRFADECERVSCYFAEEGGCRGRLQAAHIVGAQVLKRTRRQAAVLWMQGERRPILEFTEDELVADPRNGVPACERHHHLHEGPVLHCDPPAEFFEFLADVGLEHLFDNAREAA